MRITRQKLRAMFLEWKGVFGVLGDDRYLLFDNGRTPLKYRVTGLTNWNLPSHEWMTGREMYLALHFAVLCQKEQHAAAGWRD